MEKFSILPESTHQLMTHLTGKLHSFKGMVQSFPPNHYVQLCKHHDTAHYCAELPKPQVRYLERISSEYGQEAACIYNQFALVHLSTRFWDKDSTGNLPAPLVELVTEWFERIYRDVSEKSLEYYDLLSPEGRHLDDLKMDFAVCTGRATPVGGAWIVEHRRLVREKLFNDTVHRGVAGAEKKSSFYESMKQLASRLGMLDSLINLRGKWYSLTGRYGDYLVIHTANRYRRYFSDKHLDRAYRNIALLLRQDSKLLGLYRSSWFLDPKVVEMEPKLSFLARTPIQQGAIYGPVKAIEDMDIEAVLRRSPVRTAAYDRGDYHPWKWGYLWGREELLAWSGQDAQSTPKR